MKTNQKFNPSNIQNNYTGSEDNDLENLPFKALLNSKFVLIFC